MVGAGPRTWPAPKAWATPYGSSPPPARTCNGRG